MNGEPKLRTMDDILIDGQTVLVRVDFNVAVGSDGKVDQYEDYRLETSLPTINELIQKRCKVILLTHLGRPGEEDGNFDLAPIKRRLEELLQEEVRSLHSLFGQDVISAVAGLEPGSVALLPNVRTDAREMSPNEKFGRELAAVAQVYINEAFSVSHREQTSITVLPKLLPSCAGRRTVIEHDVMMKLVKHPARPYVAIASGAKVNTKVSLLRNLLSTVDFLCLGGRIANTFLISQGYSLANNYDHADITETAKLLAAAKDKIILPADLMVSRAGKNETVSVEEIGSDVSGVWDVGPKSVDKFLHYCQQASTVMWNGPLGKCEEEPYNLGTEKFAAGLAKMAAFTVVGGGDTVNVLERMNLVKRFSHVSVGGGAMVCMLEGNPMPGLEPLYQ